MLLFSFLHRFPRDPGGRLLTILWHMTLAVMAVSACLAGINLIKRSSMRQLPKGKYLQRSVGMVILGGVMVMAGISLFFYICSGLPR